MSTDPIKLIRQITEPKPTVATKASETAATTAAATTKANSTASQAKDYVLSQSLKAKMSGGTGGGTRTQELASNNAKDVQDYYESAAKARKADAAAANKSNPTDGVLSEAKGKTAATTHSAEVQASLAKMTKAKDDAAMKAVDPKLASVLGVSKIIGTA